MRGSCLSIKVAVCFALAAVCLLDPDAFAGHQGTDSCSKAALGTGSYGNTLDSTQRGPTVSDELLTELAGKLESDALWQNELDLVGFGTRFTFREENLAAADWLLEKLSSFGLEVEFADDYSFAGRLIRNVVGTLRGTVEPERVVVLSAHFDTILFPSELNTYIDAPGADDNTTSDATVLECARVLSQYRPNYTIKFVLLSGEEQCMLGSEYLFTKWIDDGMNVVANVNLDCLGWSDDGSLKIRTDVNRNSEWLLDYSSRATPFTSLNVKQVTEDSEEEIWVGSDHIWFWHYGIPALFIGEGPGNPYWHTVNDSLDNVSRPLLEECAKLTLLTTAALAFDEPSRPSLSVYTSLESLQGSDRCNVDISFINPGNELSVLFYLCMLTPEGRGFFYPSWGEEPVGLEVKLPPQTWSKKMTLCCIEMPCSSPPILTPGSYRFAASITDTGGTPLCDLATASFKVSEWPRCPQGMVRIPGGSYTDHFGNRHFVQEFCIDMYEYPNKLHEAPLQGVGWPEAWAKCMEQGKFLCAKDQWMRACKGPEDFRFPYGNEYRTGACNTEGSLILASGAYDQCVSGFGVYDMSGNVFEWTSGSQWQNAVFGGHFASEGFASSCDFGLYPYPVGAMGQMDYAGFRCCWH